MKDTKRLKKSIGLTLLEYRNVLERIGGRPVPQDEVAERAGISVRYYGKVERGESMPSVAALMDISRGLRQPFAVVCNSIIRNLQIFEK